MAISVSTIASKRALTSRARVQAELGITTDGALLDALIDQATAAVESYCRRTFAREVLTETLPGFGDVHLQLSRRPLISVATVTGDSGTQTITDYSIADRDQATLYRQAGWAWTSQVAAGLTGWQTWPGAGIPIANSEEPTFSVTYTAGYIVPSQYLLGVTTISAATADNSFNDSASALPSLLKAGDVISVSGMATAANNGRFVVSGTPTTSKIVVTASLTTEAAGAACYMSFEPVPGARRMDDVEKACVETVKSWYLARKDSGSVVEKQAGPMRLRYADAFAGSSLPGSAVGLLRPWVQSA